jgi:hypothetical protein
MVTLNHAYAVVGRRAVVAYVGVLLSVAGGGLFGSYTFIRLPGRSYLELDEQPAPDWLWKVGAVLFVMGILLVAAGVLSSPKYVPGTVVRSSHLPGWVWVAPLVLVWILVPALAGVVSPESRLRWLPLGTAAAALVAAPVLAWFRERWVWGQVG